MTAIKLPLKHRFEIMPWSFVDTIEEFIQAL